MFLPVSASVYLFTLIIRTNETDTGSCPSTHRTPTQYRHSLSFGNLSLYQAHWICKRVFVYFFAVGTLPKSHIVFWIQLSEDMSHILCRLLTANLSDDFLYSIICDCFQSTNWSFACPLCLFVLVGRAGQPATQLLEQSLSADSTSLTLESLQPDTEYVISLYPLFPRNSASPSILNARTRESSL